MGYDGAQGILYKYGANAFEILIAIPMLVGSTPAGSYRDSSSVQVIINGLQRGLNKLGAGLRIDGKLGHDTEAAIKNISGAEYYDKKWIEIYSDLDKAIRSGYTMPRVSSTGASFVPTSGEIPWTLIAVSGVAAFVLLR